MSLPHGLLGLLTYSDSTGYDLSKLFADSLNFFWNAQSSQIYRELDRMEKTGWVSSQVIIQEGRPNKRLYSITPDGRGEFTRWLSDFQYKPENPHNALTMRIFFGAEIDPQKTIELLEKFRQQCVGELESLQTAALHNIELYGQTFSGGGFRKAYWKITVDAGISELKTLIAWAGQSAATLKGAGQSAASLKEAGQSAATLKEAEQSAAPLKGAKQSAVSLKGAE